MSAAAATNARAARLTLLLAGAAAQFAVMPILSGVSDVVGMVALLVIGFVNIRLPLPQVAPGNKPGALKLTMAPRQATSLVIIMLGAVLVLARVNSFDPNSKAAALATLLVVVQVAHCLALQTRREAALGCAIVLVMLSVGASFAGDVTLLIPMMVALPAVAVTTALLHRGSLIEGAAVVSAGGVGSIIRACVVPVAMAVVVGLVVFLALPNSGHLRARNRPGSGSATSATGSTGTPSSGSRTASNPGAGALDLRLRGPLSNAPIFEAAAGSPAYWQGAIFSTFDGRRWTADGPIRVWPSSGGSSVAPRDAAEPADLVVTSYHVRVLMTGPLDAVLAPGLPRQYTGPGRVALDADGTAHLSQGPVAGGIDSYVVASAVPRDTSDAVLRAAVGADPSDAQWLRLPSDLPDRVGALATSLTANAPSRLDAVNVIDQYLRTHEKYNLNSPLPAAGDDAVDDFLFVSHQGFCEQYATAAVVMLRTLGIPARLVTGYVGGDLAVDRGSRVFGGSDAHAWVQVFYPGVGWVNSDPTAGAALQPVTQSLRQRVGKVLTSWWRLVPGGRGGALVGVVALSMLGLGAAWSWRRIARRRRRYADLDRGRSGDGAVLTAYLRLDAALHAAGHSPRASSESFGEFARRLGGVIAAPAEVRAAIWCLERETYGADPPSAEESAGAVELFDRLRAAAADQPVALASVNSR
jgi:protein-glutamine gamma-glutamyltransferase